MAWETSASGSVFELKVQGFGRFIGAAFLATWLAGWAAGEAFALSILAFGGWSLVTGRPPGVGHQPVTLIAALPVGLFLLIWLFFWTIGGIAAGRELLRLLYGRDRFVIRQGDLEVEHSYGLFRSIERL